VVSSGAKPYIGRFAPSPTGELHFGSLVSAVGSYLQARSNDGTWLIRIEDIDPPREVAGSAKRIEADLDRLGMHSDDKVLYQSTRLGAYQDALENLLKQGLAYPCGCSRSDLKPGQPYPGTCRNGLAPGKQPRSIRLRVPNKSLGMEDGLLGFYTQNLTETCGDFVIRRADGLIAYQLAVVVDDNWQGITEVVRGTDLLDSTPRQLHLQNLLGYPQPGYIHLPLALDPQGKKLGKREGSDPLSNFEAHQCLRMAMQFLGLRPPESRNLDALWDWGVEHWNIAGIPTTGMSGYTSEST
jgi:glutamyl-Q tRNA(Asp) synthetase